VGRSLPLAIRFWASALEELILMDTVKSEILEFFPKQSGDFSKGDAEKQYLGF
jgi:hypothetical protein